MTGWQTVFSTPWFSVESQPAVDAKGQRSDGPFYRLSQPDGAVIAPLTADGRLLLIRQYRQALGRETIEFPAGNVDPGESPADAIVRELHEETGYRCAAIDQVLEGELRLSRENAKNYFFVGRSAVRDPNFEPEEPITCMLVEPADFRRLVIDNRFDHIAVLPIVLLAGWKLGLDF